MSEALTETLTTRPGALQPREVEEATVQAITFNAPTAPAVTPLQPEQQAATVEGVGHMNLNLRIPAERDDPGFGTHIQEAVEIVRDWRRS